MTHSEDVLRDAVRNELGEVVDRISFNLGVDRSLILAEIARQSSGSGPASTEAKHGVLS